MDGELLAEYAQGGAATVPQKEYGYRNPDGSGLLITAEAAARTNVALAANGGVATAQNYTQDYGGLHFQPSYANDGLRYMGANGDRYWRDEHGLPTWVQVDFSGAKLIDEVDVITARDDYATQADPSATQTFSNYGMTSFSVQYWSGSNWVTIPGGNFSGNNLVWRKVSFPAVTTTKIRVTVAATADGVARLMEVEAWGYDTTNLNWLVTDQLGTPRLIFDKTGSLAATKRHDYLPFGEELFATQGARTTTLGYSATDGVRQKFTQKERDNETGLDYFLARYYSSTQGRFTSPDATYSLSQAVSPQTWNRYASALNNPFSYVDRNGKWPTWIHELIIDNAYPGLTEQERYAIKLGSWYVDYMGTDFGGTLSEGNANEHAMRGTTQTYLEAVAGYQNFIDSKNAEAAASNGVIASGVDQGLVAFGGATHPIADNTSPAHSPFQVYQGPPVPVPGDPISIALFAKWIIDLRAHSEGEASINKEQMLAATQALRENYRSVYGEKRSQRAFTRRNPMGFLSVGQIYNVPSWSNVLATVTVYPDGTMKAKGDKLIYHPSKTK